MNIFRKLKYSKKRRIFWKMNIFFCVQNFVITALKTSKEKLPFYTPNLKRE